MKKTLMIVVLAVLMAASLIVATACSCVKSYSFSVEADDMAKFEITINRRHILKTSETAASDVEYSLKRNSNVKIFAESIDSNKKFTHWINQTGEIVSKENPFSFKMKEDTVLSPQFEDILHNYTLNIENGYFFGANNAKLTSGSIREGTTVNLYSVNDVTGKVFSHWKIHMPLPDGKINTLIHTEREYSLVMPKGNVNIEIVFVEKEYQIEVVGGVGGGRYLKDDKVYLTPVTSQAGHSFVGWSYSTDIDNVFSISEVLEIVALEDITIFARFAVLNQLNVVGGTIESIQNDEWGWGYGFIDETNQGRIIEGALVEIKANYHKHLVFKGWFMDGKRVSEEERFSFEMPNEDITLVAEYEPKEMFTVTVSGEGKIVGECDCIEDCDCVYNYEYNKDGELIFGKFFVGEYITIEAPDRRIGKIFLYWLVDGEKLYDTYFLAGSIYTFKVTEDIQFEAVYDDNVWYTVHVVDGNYSGRYRKNSMLTVTALSYPGKVFVGWSKDKSIDEGGTPIKLNGITVGPKYEFELLEDVKLVANYRTANVEVFGGVIVGGFYDGQTAGFFGAETIGGTSVTITAIAEDREFEGWSWTEGGDLIKVGEEFVGITYTFSYTGSVKIFANWAE